MNTHYSLALRIWHWLHALTILGLLGTFFLRKTFLSWKDNSEIIISQMATFGLEVTAEQAKIVAQAIRAPMWEWHIIFGFVLASLLLVRLIILFAELGFHFQSDGTLHTKVVHFGYYILYIIIGIMVVSGMSLHYHEALGLSDDVAHTLKEIHEFLAWGIAIFVPLHIIGVMVADMTTRKGLTSKMISG